MVLLTGAGFRQLVAWLLAARLGRIGEARKRFFFELLIDSGSSNPCSSQQANCSRQSRKPRIRSGTLRVANSPNEPGIAGCLELIPRYRERMSKVKKLLHTRYRVDDLERTVKFYREVLGLEEVRRHKSPRGSELVFLKAPGSEELIELCCIRPAARCRCSRT